MKYVTIIAVMLLISIIVFVLKGVLTIESKPEINRTNSLGRSSSREKRMSPLLVSEEPFELDKNKRIHAGKYIQDMISSNTDTIKTQSNPSGPNLTDYIYRGANLAIERVAKRHEEARNLLGKQPLKYPYKAQMENIYTMVIQSGYDRNTLFEFYKPVLELTLNLTDNDLKNATKTWNIIQLFKRNNVDEIKKIITVRLQNNKNDLAALLLIHNLDTEQGKVDEVFQNAQRIINALHNVELKGVDKRAILSHLLDDLSMTFAYRTEEEIKNSLGKRITNRCYPFLYMMELSGDW